MSNELAIFLKSGKFSIFDRQIEIFQKWNFQFEILENFIFFDLKKYFFDFVFGLEKKSWVYLRRKKWCSFDSWGFQSVSGTLSCVLEVVGRATWWLAACTTVSMSMLQTKPMVETPNYSHGIFILEWPAGTRSAHAEFCGV